jgi:hypothetical protein
LSKTFFSKISSSQFLFNDAKKKKKKLGSVKFPEKILGVQGRGQWIRTRFPNKEE